MKVGVILPMFSGNVDLVLDAAREAEAFGYDGVFAFDHLFPPGRSPDAPSLEAFATLAAAAAATDRIALGTLVARVSLRPPGLLAKAASWLDAASGGRLILGLGTGDATDWAEHRAYGIPMPGKEERRTHLHELLVALRALFRGDPYAGGKVIPPLAGPLAPPPARPGGPPLWVGAQADPLVRMAARLADGWNGWGLPPDRFSAKVELLAEAAAAEGRAVEATWAGIVVVGEDRADTEALMTRRRERGLDEAWAGTPADLVSFLRQLEDAGAAWVVLVTGGPRDRRELVAREVLPHL